MGIASTTLCRPRPGLARALFLLAACIGAGPLPAAVAQTAPPIIELDRIVAVVNDDVIVESELQARMRLVKDQLRQGGTALPPEDVLGKQVLERLILERLQIQIAERAGMRVEEETLNKAVEQVARQNNLDVSQFKQILERDGFDFARFREDIRNEILISRLQQRQVQNRITVTDRDIDNYVSTLEKQGTDASAYRLSHILVAVPEAASSEAIADARRQAERVVEQLRNGADFARLAVSQSDGQQALQGGDLGWRNGSELPTIFADVVPEMRKGEISDPIKSSSGFHVVQLADVRGDAGRHVVVQTRARHILVRPNEVTSDAEAKTRLEQLRVRIENGDDFEELARAHSDDRGSALQGGDLGWVNPGDTVPDFQSVMDTIPAGGLSEPFKTRFGWHLVQVLERREFDDTEKVKRARAADQIRQRKMDEELQNWLRQIRDEAYVELRLDER
ncbi:MAG TPA: SIMPL domain-containing protein [Gammaproteobacteria bacterium]|nr:SIMPL domain-containing protein [Gammaproteobacteria bacterium]